MIESIERRLLMAATLGADGTLAVVGIPATVAPFFGGNETVDFGPGSGTITTTVSGTVQTFQMSAVKRLIVTGGIGDDIDIKSAPVAAQTAETSLAALPIVVYGGPGGTGALQAGSANIIVDLESQTNICLTVIGGSGDDNITVGIAGTAVIHGGAGNDSISVEPSITGNINAAVYGDAGNDTLSATGAGDAVVTLSGGPGDDTLRPGFGVAADLSGGTGDDTADLSAWAGNQQIYLDGSKPSTDSVLTGMLGFDGTIENVDTGLGNDLVVGTAGNNQLKAGPGDDTLIGMAGNDTLIAGTGRDTLLGGDGNDVLESTRTTGGPNVIDGGTDINTAYTNPADTVANVQTNINGGPTSALSGTTTGTAGSYDAQGNVAAQADDGNLETFFDAPTADGGYVEQDLGSLQKITQIAYAPRPGFESRMIGGQFQGSDTADFSSGVTTLYTIIAAPQAGTLTPVLLSASPVRYVRYVGPAGSFCNIAEMQFFGSTPPDGIITGSVVNDVYADGSVEVPMPGVTVYLDLHGDQTLDKSDPKTTTNADGQFAFPLMPAGYYDVRELVPAGSESDGDVGSLDLTDGLIARVTGTNHFDVERTGTLTGPAGSYHGLGNTIADAVDGSLSTFYDGQSANGNVIEIDFGTEERVDQIRYAPRAGFADRMVGGYFELAASANFQTDDVLLSVGEAPAQGRLTTISFDDDGDQFRYVRYVSPPGSYGNLAEMEFYG